MSFSGSGFIITLRSSGAGFPPFFLYFFLKNLEHSETSFELWEIPARNLNASTLVLGPVLGEASGEGHNLGGS